MAYKKYETTDTTLSLRRIAVRVNAHDDLVSIVERVASYADPYDDDASDIVRDARNVLDKLGIKRYLLC